MFWLTDDTSDTSLAGSHVARQYLIGAIPGLQRQCYLSTLCLCGKLTGQ